MNPALTIGRIVHYQLTETKTRPMIITEVLTPLMDGGHVHGTIFLSTADLDPKGAMYGQSPSPVRAISEVPYDGDNRIGTWHWPQQT